jgi:hypothetical protein
MFGQLLMKDQRRVCYGLVTKPQRSRYGQSYAYYACYSGVEWAWCVTDHPAQEEQHLVPLAPQLNGTMLLAAIPFEQSNSVKIFVEQTKGGSGAGT